MAECQHPETEDVIICDWIPALRGEIVNRLCTTCLEEIPIGIVPSFRVLSQGEIDWIREKFLKAQGEPVRVLPSRDPYPGVFGGVLEYWMSEINKLEQVRARNRITTEVKLALEELRKDE